jgi:hypothetical protein
MSRKRTKRDPSKDPFLRACSSCGAEPGKPCVDDAKPKATAASRLVHAARLEGPHA